MVGDENRQYPPACVMNPCKGPVTVVRFSPCSRYLASGSEEGGVHIWKQDSTNQWVLHKELEQFEKDVQDLAWAPDSSILVAAGLDGKVIVWKGEDFKFIQHVKAHKSHVKGLTFDPANMYFATASDDRTVKIIKYDETNSDEQYSVDATISDPFNASPLSTYRRCSWSPDGNHIAASNATNGPVTTVTIINRGTWDSDISLVGHNTPCEVASFCPRIFSLDKEAIGSKHQGANLITVIATAGQDRTLAIWNTSNPRPLLVASNVTEKSITDIAWSPDGSTLYASSLDGSITVAKFEEGELGWVVPLEENVNQLTRYGTKEKGSAKSKSTVDSEKMSDKESDDIIMTDAPPTLKQEVSQPASKKEIVDNKSKPSGKVEKPTITKDGKKRIAPVLLTSSNTAETPIPSNIESTPSAISEVVERDAPSKSLPPGGVSALVVRPKRRAGSGDQETGVPDPKRFRYDGEFHYIKSASLPISSDVSRARLSVPKVRTYIKTGHLEKETHVLEIRNNASVDAGPTSVTITSKGNVIFRDILPKFGHLAAGSGDNFWAVSTEDGTLYLYSPNGRRLVPGIVLGCTLSFLESQDSYLMAVTSTGLLYVWNVDTLTAMHSSVPIAPILDSEMSASDDGLVKGPSITQCGITSKGKVVITLTNGDGFIYSSQMLTWLRISEAWWAFGSQYWGSTHIEKARAESKSKQDESSTPGVVSLVEHRTNQEAMIKAGGRGKYLQRMAKNRMLKEGYENFERYTSTAHLENRLSAAIMAESGEELVSFLKMYAVRLAAEGMGNRLEELCKELLGPTIRVSNRGSSSDFPSNKWAKTICGIDKHELLKDVVLSVGKYREIQAVVVKYASIVGVLDRINVT